MFIRAKYVLQFSRRNDRQNTGIDPMLEAGGRKVACENSRPSSLIASYADVLRLVTRDKPKNVCVGGYFAPGPSGVSRLFSQGRGKAEGSISYNYRFHIVTRFKS